MPALGSGHNVLRAHYHGCFSASPAPLRLISPTLTKTIAEDAVDAEKNNQTLAKTRSGFEAKKDTHAIQLGIKFPPKTATTRWV